MEILQDVGKKAAEINQPSSVKKVFTIHSNHRQLLRYENNGPESAFRIKNKHI
jgi:hypothetical protein